MLGQGRITSSVFMIGVILAGIINFWVFVLVLMALTLGGLYEFFTLMKKKGFPIYSYTGIVMGILIPISILVRFQPTKGWELLFIVLLLLAIFLAQFTRKENVNAIVGISTTLFGVLYVGWFFSFLIKIRFLFPEIPGAGVNLLAFILLVTKAGDVGALLVGNCFGRHLLLPRVSPNKTIEGGAGGLLFSVGAALAASSLIPSEFEFSFGRIIFMGVFFGALGQLGDLSESLIKRDCNVKDSGKFLPAIGGVLDAIDSVLFTAPAFYFYMSSIVPS